MIRIEDYIINKDHVLYIEKYGLFYIIVNFKNGECVKINYNNEDRRDQIFDKLDIFDELRELANMESER